MANDNHEAFIKQIVELDIELSVNDEGVFTVCTTSEPLFCYDAESREEAAALVGRTLASYGRLFFGLDGLEIPVQADAKVEARVAVERSTPVGRLRPVLDLAA